MCQPVRKVLEFKIGWPSNVLVFRFLCVVVVDGKMPAILNDFVDAKLSSQSPWSSSSPAAAGSGGPSSAAGTSTQADANNIALVSTRVRARNAFRIQCVGRAVCYSIFFLFLAWHYCPLPLATHPNLLFMPCGPWIHFSPFFVCNNS